VEARVDGWREKRVTEQSAPVLPPATRRALRERLLALSPRAFELFAGDLLTYIGLQNVAVTRYVGDGGIDAHGDLLADSGLVRVPAGVQVKRHRRNVQRADIDRFIGALSGQYQHGIFITTAGYAAQARLKAAASAPRVDPIDGDQILTLMGRHQLGLAPEGEPRIDEDYFLGFEAQGDARRALREGCAEYAAGDGTAAAPASPEDDLISLRALSYLLRVDHYTLRAWLQRGRLGPDHTAQQAGREVYFFRRDRVAAIQQALGRVPGPGSGPEWREAFLAFVGVRTLSRSYKPVLLKALLELVNGAGEAPLTELAATFQAFYVRRRLEGLPVEFGVPLLAEPAEATLQQIQRLIVTNPLERFIIQGFLQHDSASGSVRFAPELWAELRLSDLFRLRELADAQLDYYYRRRRPS